METSREATLSLTPPRPAFNRQRSNSLPFTEPLQCTATEAAIMFAAERAVLNRRRAPSGGEERERRRPLSARNPRRAHHDNIRRSRQRTPSEQKAESLWSGDESSDIGIIRNHRPRQASRTTITNTTAHTVEIAPATTIARSNTSPTAQYSAGLAEFIQGRLVSLNSPPGNQAIHNPRSCPNLSQVPRKSRSQPNGRCIATEEAVERPSLRSSFSAWSTPGDSSAFEEDDDDVPFPNDADLKLKTTITNVSTPSVLDFYQNSAADSSFLLPDTPADREDDDTFSVSSGAPSTIKGGRSMSNSTTATHASQPLHGPDSTSTLDVPDQPRSSILREKSYFGIAKPFTTLVAISPYEGQALTTVYDMQVHGSKRIVTEGMAFEMFRELQMPARHSRVM